MVIHVKLRHDQNLLTTSSCSKFPTVKTYCPKWISPILTLLWKELKNEEILIHGNSRSNKLITKTNVCEKPDLLQLQQIARNESSNVSGEINFAQYGKLPIPVILSLKDLARQCVTIGLEETTYYGGYPRLATRTKQESKVIICDLAALQFQKHYNTGRHVIIQQQSESDKNNNNKGLLDEELFREIVGEEKKEFKDIQRESENRYNFVKSTEFGNCYFDSLAYYAFVKSDVVFVLHALSSFAESSRFGNIVFRFLKYGTGFYAGDFGHFMESKLAEAVVDGVEEFCESQSGTQGLKFLRRVELPFYPEIIPGSKLQQEVKGIEEKYAVKVIVTQLDCLDTSYLDDSELLATTNCGDSHAPFGIRNMYLN